MLSIRHRSVDHNELSHDISLAFSIDFLSALRLFTRRHPRTIDRMREEIGVKLDSRLSLLSLKKEIPFLQ